MKEIKLEFENYLKELVSSYPKATAKMLSDPSSLSDVGAKSRDFNTKAQNKISELAAKYSVPTINVKVEVALLIVQYQGKLLHGHL